MQQWAMGAPTDAFERVYAAGTVDEFPERGHTREAAPRGSRFGLAHGLALGGCVLTPDEALDPGYVVVGPDGSIAEVGRRRPGAVPLVETEGVVLPGLIDLHGHPDFNVFAPWEPPELFANRYEWRASDLYRALVRAPQNRLLEALPPGTQNRYAEIRALVGGVTAVQGASGSGATDEESLVRNVDRRIFGRHRARALIDLPADDDEAGLRRLSRVVADIGAGKVDAFYIHLAEGRRDDARSQAELDRLVELDALTPATVVVHGTALGQRQLGRLADAGAKLVWSPQSNLRLYAETTLAATALELGLPVGLGADWLPSGSPSLLAELKVARRVLASQGRAVEPLELVVMVTSGAAAIAGLGDRLGSIATGRPADLAVLERRHEDPWVNVVEADPSWVELVMIGGDLSYGRADWITAVAPDAAARLEKVVAWGRPMLLDTAYTVGPPGETPPTLAELRAALIANYPPLGPIFA
ncbi:MAG TPA: amidohydrolase family protein [Acidimicrobiales bacterium]|nr:amidohydrolase family protein [Acidimicrobiales bacterium]